MKNQIPEYANLLLRSSKANTVTKTSISPFNQCVRIVDAKGELLHAIALLDTQCQIGNWVSARLVNALGKSGDISHVWIPPDVQDANGVDVTPCGTIRLKWLWRPDSTRYHEADFYVLDNSCIDIIFGRKYIVENGLLERPKGVMLTLVEHKRQDARKYCLLHSLERKHDTES